MKPTPPPAELPDWVPQPVAVTALALLECAVATRDTEGHAALARLVVDPQMRQVWGELRKKHCRVSAPDAWSEWLKLFKQLPGEHNLQNPEDLGVAAFFAKAFLLTVPCRPFVPRKSSYAERLRFEAQMLDIVEGVAPPDSIPGFDLLCNLADVKAPAPRRNRGNAVIRFYATQLAGTTKKLFGRVLHSTVATTTNVALALKAEREISRDDVRNWMSRLG